MRKLIDFHSHILPGIDDGSRSVEESIAMLQMEAEQEVGCVVATPHFYGWQDNLDQFLAQRERSEQLLRQAMEAHPGLPELHIGAEVHYFTGISQSQEIAALAIDGGSHILIEMPGGPWTDSMYRELEQMYARQGLVPIIAHVERCIGRFRSYGIPRRLASLPVLVQSNASFFLNRKTCAAALRMLKKEQIHLLGSDCHNLTSRKPNLAAAVKLIETHLDEQSIRKIRALEKTVLESTSNRNYHTVV